MKKLLLLSSSRFLQNDLTPYFGEPLKDLKIAHIITASKGKGVNDLSYLERTRNIFKATGCYYEDLDLDGKDKNQLKNFISKFNVIFVNGGSTFYLLKSIRESGFGKIINELMDNGLIYMVASAGSYVACPTIEMATWKHQNKYDNYGIKDYTALNLVPFLMSVHYEPEYKNLLKEKISQTEYPVKILDDNQAVLVIDKEVRLLGGEEIRL